MGEGASSVVKPTRNVAILFRYRPQCWLQPFDLLEMTFLIFSVDLDPIHEQVAAGCPRDWLRDINIDSLSYGESADSSHGPDSKHCKEPSGHRLRLDRMLDNPPYRDREAACLCRPDSVKSRGPALSGLSNFQGMVGN